MNKTDHNAGRQIMMGLLTILLSLASSAFSFVDKTGRAGGFSISTVIAFVAVLLSLMSVRDQGRNVLAKIAFFMAVAALFVTVGFSALAA